MPAHRFGARQRILLKHEAKCRFRWCNRGRSPVTSLTKVFWLAFSKTILPASLFLCGGRAALPASRDHLYW
jgi:hypothetical protein